MGDINYIVKSVVLHKGKRLDGERMGSSYLDYTLAQ